MLLKRTDHTDHKDHTDHTGHTGHRGHTDHTGHTGQGKGLTSRSFGFAAVMTAPCPQPHS